jgi:hypothetical protein
MAAMCNKGTAEDSLTLSTAQPDAEEFNDALNELELKELFNGVEKQMVPLLECCSGESEDFASAWTQVRYQLLDRALNKEEGAVGKWAQKWKDFLILGYNLFGDWLETGLPPRLYEYTFRHINIAQAFECWLLLPSSVLGTPAQQFLEENSKTVRWLRTKTKEAEQKRKNYKAQGQENCHDFAEVTNFTEQLSCLSGRRHDSFQLTGESVVQETNETVTQDPLDEQPAHSLPETNLASMHSVGEQ